MMKRPALITAVVALSVGLAACGTSRAEAVAMLEQDIVDSCHAAVAHKAKHPGGVEFIDTDVKQNEKAESWDDFLYIVDGFADFPNSFGVPGRYTYRCHADFNDFDNPELETTVFDRNGTSI